MTQRDATTDVSVTPSTIQCPCPSISIPLGRVFRTVVQWECGDIQPDDDETQWYSRIPDVDHGVYNHNTNHSTRDPPIVRHHTPTCLSDPRDTCIDR